MGGAESFERELHTKFTSSLASTALLNYFGPGAAATRSPTSAAVVVDGSVFVYRVMLELAVVFKHRWMGPACGAVPGVLEVGSLQGACGGDRS